MKCILKIGPKAESCQYDYIQYLYKMSVKYLLLVFI